jgi:hypothetical protein
LLRYGLKPAKPTPRRIEISRTSKPKRKQPHTQTEAAKSCTLMRRLAVCDPANLRTRRILLVGISPRRPARLPLRRPLFNHFQRRSSLPRQTPCIPRRGFGRFPLIGQCTRNWGSRIWKMSPNLGFAYRSALLMLSRLPVCFGPGVRKRLH